MTPPPALVLCPSTVVIQLPSCVHLFSTPWTAGLSVPHHLLKFAQVHVHYINDAIQPSHPLTPLLLLPSILPSVRDFSNESAIWFRQPKYWSFSFSISPSVAGRGTPSRTRNGSCLTLGNELSEETHVLTKQEILLGRAPGWRAGG